jgi:hypothetical protein
VAVAGWLRGLSIGLVLSVGSSNAAPGQEERRKTYLAPALEIVAFDALLNLFDRQFLGAEYNSSLSSISRNLRRGWVVENDPFLVNQFGHPYQGGMYHGFARAAGLNYWEAFGYTFAGSALWEIAGETTPPSWNDQIASGVAGSFLGESLYRIASLLRENLNGETPLWRNAAADAVSPPNGFHRRVLRRSHVPFSSRNAAYYRRWQLGVSGTTQHVPGASSRVQRNEAMLDLAFDYGLPGRPGYVYTRPFDYFTLQATGSSATGFENILSRGLLVGRGYAAGRDSRGVWGVYGSYDYIAPQLFRVSSTAVSLGTTAQWWLSESVAAQGTATAGMGWAAVGTIHGVGERDYHYGVAPQALVAARFIFGNRVSVDFTGREYFVTGVAAARDGGHDNIVRADAAFTVRLNRQNAIAVKYLVSRRDAFTPGLGRRAQERGTIGLFYTVLGHDRFGAVEWR